MRVFPCVFALMGCVVLAASCGAPDVEPAPSPQAPVVDRVPEGDAQRPLPDLLEEAGMGWVAHSGWRAGLPDVMARVGDVDITRERFLYELALAQAAVRARMEEAGQETPEHVLLDEAGGRRLFQSIIDNELLAQFARTQGFEVDEDLVEEMLEERRSVHAAAAAFEASLARRQLTIEEYRGRLAQRVLIGRLIESRMGNVKADEARVMADYQQLLGAGAFDVSESIVVRQIFVPVEEGVDEGRVEAVLQEGYARFEEGAHFEEVVAGVAEQFPEALVWEELTLTRDRIDPLYEEFVFRSEAGETPAPFRTEGGWVFVVVTARAPARSLSLEEVRPRLEQHILAPDHEAAFVALVEEAMREIPVMTYWDPDTQEETDQE